jgi:NADPH2:quinone reductase
MRRSHAVVGFWLSHTMQRPAMFAEALSDVFARAVRGDLRVVVGETYPLSEVRRAHEELQGRRTQGKLLLDPSR